MKIVICCDGTNNSFQRNLTNVARMSLIAVNDEKEQFVYFDAGVGNQQDHLQSETLWTRESGWPSGLRIGTGAERYGSLSANHAALQSRR